MSNVAEQVAQIERELLALTSNQPPNPAQITTFKVTHTTAVNAEVKTIVFDDGVPRFIQLFAIAANSVSYIFEDAGQLKVKEYGMAGSTYTLVSLGAFSLV